MPFLRAAAEYGHAPADRNSKVPLLFNSGTCSLSKTPKPPCMGAARQNRGGGVEKALYLPETNPKTGNDNPSDSAIRRNVYICVV